MNLLIFAAVMAVCMTGNHARAEEGDGYPWSRRVQTVLEVTKPLEAERGGRLPLYLWPAMDPGVMDEGTLEQLVMELDRRGIGLIASWSPDQREESLARGLALARVQKRLGLRVNVNANECLHRFYNGDERTAHRDEQGNAFWDDSFGSRIMGCPFTLDLRRDAIREQVEYFARAYHNAGIGVDFAFADWEIDGPIEVNRAYPSALGCVRCREHIGLIEDFRAFQAAVRSLRCNLQRYVFSEPMRTLFPGILVGNYAVYPHDGWRYWYDFFEFYAEGQPCRREQNARYREWYHEFPQTGYTFAMPVAYPWYRTFGWYDFEDHDYRWFYNMLKVASNAGEHTPADIPVISFVHWHTTSVPRNPDPAVSPLSADAYQELLWHMLLRGTDTFFVWTPASQDAEEVRLAHEVYAAAQQYGGFLEKGTPFTFDIPARPAAVVSGLVLDGRVLVRRTDFGGDSGPVVIQVEGAPLEVASAPGVCRIIDLPGRGGEQ